MPIYNFKCTHCDNQSDYLVKFSDPMPPCVKCGGTDQEKQLATGTAFCLMGRGWSKSGMNSKKVDK